MSQNARNAPELIVRDAEGAEAPKSCKKVACWVCGRDLIFNSIRARAGGFIIQLFCKRCRLPRSLEMHLHPSDLANHEEHESHAEAE